MTPSTLASAALQTAREWTGNFDPKQIGSMRQAIGRLCRRRPKPPQVANDNAANDNELVHPKAPRHRGSFVSIVQEGRGAPRCVVSLGSADARALKIREGHYATVRAVRVVDPFYATEEWAFVVAPARQGAADAVLVERVGGGMLRIRKRGVCPIPTSHRAFYLPAVSYAPTGKSSAVQLILPYQGRKLGLDSLKTLSLDGPGFDRRLLMTGWKTWKGTTAGDECYTLAFVWQWGLRAAGRDQYDLDICTMDESGSYAGKLVGHGQIKTCWGKTPEKYRNLFEALRGVAARYRYTAAGPFGSMTREWDGELFWINPPYSRRTWACFLERAQQEVEQDARKLFLTLTPDDNVGEHGEVVFGKNVCKITLEKQVAFFKSKTAKIEPIAGNQLVIFGRGLKMRKFLRCLVNILHEDGFISKAQKETIICKYVFAVL